jgi:hypothetical protein
LFLYYSVVWLVDEQEATVEFTAVLYGGESSLRVSVQLAPHSFPMPKFSAPMYLSLLLFFG